MASSVRVLGLAAFVAMAACASDDTGAAPPTGAVDSTTRATVGLSPASGTAATTAPASTLSSPSATTARPSTTQRPATTSTSTLPPTTTEPPTTTLPDPIQTVELGRSVEGRPITAYQRGTPGGTKILVIGVIHGDEAAGVAVIEDLMTREVPDGIELWLVESMNPDGQRAVRRTNANLVDLNRNFPHEWAPLGIPGQGQYAGPSAASEPETQAMVSFIAQLEPALVIWYHQDLFRIAPGTGRAGRIRARYAELTGLPIDTITGGVYTGTAASWAKEALPQGIPFIVELGPTLSDDEAQTHAQAVLTIAADL